MHYLASRPSRWSPDRSWPAIVVITDAYRNFDSTAALFAATPAAERFVIVVPLVLSGGGPAQLHQDDFDYDPAAWARAGTEGNCGFDEHGLQAMIEDLRRRDHVTRLFITGWEAGGHVVLSQVLNHPERWDGAAVATPNFIGRCVNDGATPAPDRDVPMRMFHGSADSLTDGRTNPLPHQWVVFDSLARKRGFTNLAQVEVPEGQHGPLAAAIVSYFEGLLK